MVLKVCLIGVSGYGDRHYQMLVKEAERGAAKVLAATVINPDEMPEKCARLRALGCEIFGDYRAMLDRFGPETDVCFIPTGIPLHAPMTIAALRAGANVFVEKPAAGTVQEVRAMEAASRETGRFVAVGYQSMYMKEMMVMKRAVLDGALGPVRAIKCRGLWPRTDTYYGRNGWAGRLRCGDSWVLDSPFNNALAHQLNMICFLAGTEPGKSARLRSIQAELYRGNAIESADTAALRILTREGLPLYFIVTHCSEGGYGPEVVVRGERGSMTWYAYQRLLVEYADGRSESLPVDGMPGIYEKIFRTLAQRVADGKTFVCGLDIAGTQTLCVNGAHQSSPVRPVPASEIQRVDTEDSTRTVIRGLDSYMTAAFKQEKLFSELGVPWARPAPVFSLEGYDAFTGPTVTEG